MRNLIKAATMASLLLCYGPVAAQSEETQDPHLALATALSSDELAELRFKQEMEVGFYAGLKAIPDMVQIENDCPGFFIGFGKALRPLMYQGHFEDNAWYRKQLDKLFRERLSKGAASGAAEFYGSDEGQRLLAMAVANLSADNTIAELVDEIDEENIDTSEEAYQIAIRPFEKKDWEVLLSGHENFNRNGIAQSTLAISLL